MVKTKIEYCDSSWNVISGCHYHCQYCYAQRIAERFKGCDDSPDGSTHEKFIILPEKKIVTKNGKTLSAAYPYGFTPTFHEYRLNDIKRKGLGKTVFVCSMADMFGDWVSDDVIQKIFNACIEADNHRYLFLTKNPKRYLDLYDKGKLPKRDNFWYGSTADTTDRTVFYADDYHTFISVEPILEPFEFQLFKNEKYFNTDWIILGAETGNRKHKVVPERSWIEDVVSECEKRNVPVFMKDSMKPIWGEDIITQLPWED